MNLRKLTDSEHEQVEEIMRQASIDKPMVGIFWYDTDNNDLFGVDAVDPDVLRPRNPQTSDKRHDQVWKKEHFKAVARGNRNSPYYSSVNGYDVPRGRVFKADNFYVMVGKWINKYPQAKDLILEEFNLPSDTEFRYDSHWDIGHGWSGDHM